MRKIRNWRHSLLTVLLVASLAVLITVSLLMLSVMSRSLKSFEKYVISNRYAETVSAGSLLNQELEALFTLMYNSLNSTNLSKLRLYLSESTLNYRYLELAKLMQNQLFSIETSLDIADQASIILPAYNRIISSESVVRYADDNSMESAYRQEILNATGPKIIEADHALIFCTGKYTGIGQYRNDVVIYCQASRSALTRYLSKFPQEDSSNLSLFITDQSATKLFTCTGISLTPEDNQNIAGLISGAESGTIQYVNGQQTYLLTWMDTKLVPLKLCYVTPMNVIDEQIQEYRRMIVGVCTLILLLFAGLIVFLYSMIQRPLQNVQRGLKRVENGDLSTRLNTTWSIEFQQIYGQFDRMTEHLQQLIEREYELQLLNTKAEIKQLRYQINPHFLYNTYFNLRAMLMDEEYDQAMLLADLMGRYLRYITVSAQDFALLSEEMAHATAYMEIQRIRFGNRIEIRIDELPAWAAKVEIPRLALQPLIENAFEHGIKHQEGKAIISIRLWRKERDVSIFVEDNGSNTTDKLIEHTRKLIYNGMMQEGTESVALVNIHKRLKLLYSKGSGLYLSRSTLGGFCSELRMREAFKDAADADCG